MCSNPIGAERYGAREIRAALGDSACEVLFFETLDSTNTEAKRRAVAGCWEELLIVAEQQTAGRGRLGRSFYSPGGSGVYFSLLYPTSLPMGQIVTVTSAASVAVLRAVRRLCGVEPAIKWVNDLYLAGRKVCGILAESVPMPDGRLAVVVGIGINLREAAFPQELAEVAGSLGDNSVSRAALVAETVRELLRFLRDPADRSWLDDYRRCSSVIGRRIVWERAGERHEGVALGIDEDGGLEVRDGAGQTLVLRTGEISLRTL